ncbi:TPA: 2-C-methyl-D-erythritol 2,4-cyclodiphosphate synthase [bacterium]|nr:2-C-methyl-D-erythritol 2,4-cyclodiphosphate synthase [bacterium]
MYKIGHAIDVHKFASNRKLFLGGVEIPYSLGLLGHSDADVLLHAITEAIIGALGKGDLGTHFPDNDEKYKDIDSKLLLQHVLKMMKEEGYQIVNIDSSVLLEQPRLSPYIERIRETIAILCNTDTKNINVKAGTMEKMGFIGNKEGIMAIATVLLKKGD